MISLLYGYTYHHFLSKVGQSGFTNFAPKSKTQIFVENFRTDRIVLNIVPILGSGAFTYFHVANLVKKKATGGISDKMAQWDIGRFLSS